METYNQFRQNFHNQKIKNKWEFSKAAYSKYHQRLWDYAYSLKGTNICKIEICDEKVIMELRDSGVKLLCKENDERSMPLDILNFLNYESEQMQMIENILNNLLSRNIIDIGANIGFTSCMWAKRFSDSKIFCFEPILDTYNILLENIKINGLENIQPYNLGLSDQAGEVEFYFYPWCTANTSLKNLQHRDDAVKIKAYNTRLDDIADIQDIPIDFIKCDVEGNELFALRGGRNVIQKNLPVITIEILRKYSKEFNYNANDVVNELKQYGYELFFVEKDKIKYLEYITEEVEACNFIFLHKSKHEFLINKFSK